MKVLILLCLIVVATADLVRVAAPHVDKAVLDFVEGSAKSGSLSEALGIDEPWLTEVEEDIRTELGKILRESLNAMLEKIREEVEHGKEVGKELLEKVKEIREKMAELRVEVGDKAKEIVDKVKGKAKEALKKVLERMGLDKRSIDHQMDAVARGKLTNFLEILKQMILSEKNIQKIREYIMKMGQENPMIAQFRDFISTLSNDQLKKIINSLFQGETAMQGETWDKIKDFFKNLNIKIQEHTKKFGEWLKNTWSNGTDKLKDRYGTIKAIALEFISHAKDTSAEVAREALEFFRPYKEDLGSLWQQIVDASKEAIGQF